MVRRWREKTGSAANLVVKEETRAAGMGEEARKGAMNWESVQVVGMRCSGHMEGWGKCRITSGGGGTLGIRSAMWSLWTESWEGS